TGGVLSVPRGTEMFQFPRCPRAVLCVQTAVPLHHQRRVAPFGDPGISALARSPRRFVGLPRPSSASIAQASTACRLSLTPAPGPRRTLFLDFAKSHSVFSTAVRDSRRAHAPPFGRPMHDAVLRGISPQN